MGYLIALEDVTPPARSDGRPWETATIEESPSAEGEWTDLEALPFVPLDDDPAHPISRSFSTSNATLTRGWYRLKLDDGAGGIYTMNPVRLAYGWAPTEADVAAYIRARTKVRGSKEVGTFSDETRPTAEQVRRLIQQAVRFVSSKIGVDPCNDDLREDARSCAAIYAAMLVEQSFWPEQTSNIGSSFKSLESLWKDAIGTLKEAVQNECSGEDEGAASGPMPAGHFDDGGGMISRGNPPTW